MRPRTRVRSSNAPPDQSTVIGRGPFQRPVEPRKGRSFPQCHNPEDLSPCYNNKHIERGSRKRRQFEISAMRSLGNGLADYIAVDRHIKD